MIIRNHLIILQYGCEPTILNIYLLTLRDIIRVYTDNHLLFMKFVTGTVKNCKGTYSLFILYIPKKPLILFMNLISFLVSSGLGPSCPLPSAFIAPRPFFR